MAVGRYRLYDILIYGSPLMISTQKSFWNVLFCVVAFLFDIKPDYVGDMVNHFIPSTL